jgi:hypothetical protein
VTWHSLNMRHTFSARCAMGGVLTQLLYVGRLPSADSSRRSGRVINGNPFRTGRSATFARLAPIDAALFEFARCAQLGGHFLAGPGQ